MSPQQVVLTGGSSGIGRALLRMLVDGGFRVDVLGRRSADEFAAATEPWGRDVGYHRVDLTDLEAAAEVLHSIAADHGRLDVLINAAGVMHFENGADSNRASIESQLLTDLAAPMRLCAAAVEIMARGGSGHIVNVASTAALRPTPKLAVYAGAKAGLVHYSRSLAAEVAKSGIRVNVVCPGAVATDLAPRVHWKLIERTIPLGRLQSAEEIASLVRWLLDDAARNVTGAVFTIDGGMSL